MKKTLFHIALLACALSLTACDDYLDNVPKGEKIPTTLSDFSTLMADEYSNLREDVSQAIYLLNDRYANSATLSYDRLTRANYNWDTSINRVTENNSDEACYYVSYRAISTANLILENVDEATECTDEQRKQVAAQARIMRAMAYYRLVNYYANTYDATTASTDGGVPLITSSDVGASYTQPSVQAIYDFILEDVNAALPDLPDQGENILYNNKGAGYAFAARVYLQLSQYDKALEMANQALAINSELFDWKTFYSEHESVLTDTTSYQRIESPLGYDFCENYNFIHGSVSYATGEISIPVERAARFEEGDAEFLSRWKERTVGSETYYYGMLSGNFNRGGLTTTEVYLIKAECQARTGDVSGAMQTVNQVRSARILDAYYADLTATTADEALAIIEQVKDNAMVLTFVPFCDQRRWNLDTSTARTYTKTVDSETRSLSPDSYLWTMPFPQGAVDNAGNGSVTQNVDK
jgi:tetratricopeptide (TPR) repeat protein